MKAKKDQFQRFLEAAREHGVDETGAELERVFKKVVPPRTPKRQPPKPESRRRKRGG